eukprot:jgi/Psemu1/68946/estExt_Genemark1.C_6470005
MAPSSPKVVAEGGQQLLYPESKSTTNEESDTVSARTNTKVQFRGVEIREYARCLGDSPVAMGGPPLGLDWAYNIVERNSFSSILSRDRTSSESSEVDDIQDDDSVHSTVIPIEEFERMAIDKRRKRILKRMKLEEKAEKQIMSQSSRSLQRQASTGFVFFRDGSKLDPKNKNDLTVEQINQLSARWLKIQPVPGKLREKILLEETNLSKNEIAEATRELAKLRQQRRSTRALAGTAVDDLQVILEFCTRRIRRLRKGITKEREQEILWERARDYWQNIKTQYQNTGSDAT